VVVSEAELIASITRDRAAGKRIGFVPASFDVLRVDVVRRLQASAAKSDRLVVAVIDTEGTPVVSVKDRAELVDGVRGVDYVIICAAGQVKQLQALVAPNIT
jgi:bifunctional ADP-heptose synthase (sugar kinase/adenylyltransferase)